MAAICSQCAVRLRLAVQATSRPMSRRTLSQSAILRRSGIPTFNDTTVPELDNVLSTLREKHFNFGYLPRREQRILSNPANQQMIEDNPRTVQIGDEEVELRWVDRRKDVPPLRTLFHRAIELMTESEGGKAFRELPALLIGLNGMKKPLLPSQIEKVIRKAVQHGRAGAILECMEQANRSGMYASFAYVHEPFIMELRDLVQRQGWSKESLGKALKDVKQLARLMEADVESKHIKSSGQRSPLENPQMLGVLLELSAAHAQVAYGGKDADGQVEMYAQGLLHNFSEADLPQSSQPRQVGKQLEILQGASIVRGLRLAQRILGEQAIPEANRVIVQLEPVLAKIVSTIEAENPSSDSYKGQAVTVWNQRLDLFQ